MSEPTELKPCPHHSLQDNADTVPIIMCQKVPGGWDAFVSCEFCGARGPCISGKYKNLASFAASEAWNHRPTEAALIEALKEAGDVIESYHKNTGIDLGDASRMPFYSDTIKKIDAALKQAGVE